MNKISAIMFGACALLTFSACSNDDPAIDNGGNGNGVSTKDRVYLAIKISTPGEQSSRAAGDSFGYDYDVSDDESNVESANFYFYDEQGRYTGIKTQNWVDGNGQDTPNVEKKSSGTIVLDGLKNKKYPKYVVTVLNQANAATFTAPQNLTGWANLTTWECKNGDYYVMTTSSYLGENRVADAVEGNTAVAGSCYATELNESNFLQDTPEHVDFNETQRVQIYVERLAARVRVNVKLKAYDESKGLYETDMTVGGETNPEANTKLYVKFDGWSLFATAPTSRASKSLQGYTAATTFGDKNWKWNDEPYRRSYWGKSVIWGTEGNSLETGDTYYPSINTKFTTGMYCNECTNEYSKVIGTGNFADPNKTTTVLVAATVCKADGTPLNLVEYRGIKYLKDDFTAYILSALNLLYYTRTPDVLYTGLKDVETGANVDDIQTYQYNQIGIDDVTFAPAGDGTGSIIVKVKDGVELYEIGDEVTETYKDAGDNIVKITYHKVVNFADNSVVNKALKDRVQYGDSKAYAYTDGAMVYPIVIEHLNYEFQDGKKVAENQVVRDGQVGVVRNHAYNINITKINTLGMGIYNPKSKEEGGEPVKPEGPKDPTYYVESTINILSWKLVEQDAEI